MSNKLSRGSFRIKVSVLLMLVNSGEMLNVGHQVTHVVTAHAPISKVRVSDNAWVQCAILSLILSYIIAYICSDYDQIIINVKFNLIRTHLVSFLINVNRV